MYLSHLMKFKLLVCYLLLQLTTFAQEINSKGATLHFSNETKNLFAPFGFGMIDIKVNDQYVGSIQSSNSLTLTNVPDGRCEFEFFPHTKPTKSFFSFQSFDTLIAGESYWLNINTKEKKDFRWQVAKNNIDKKKKDSTYSDKKLYRIVGDSSFNKPEKDVQDYYNLKFDKNLENYAMFNYALISVDLASLLEKEPEGYYGFKMNITGENTIAIKKLPLIVGAVARFDFSDYKYSVSLPVGRVGTTKFASYENDLTRFKTSLFGKFGYQKEMKNNITLMTTINAGPTFENSSLNYWDTGFLYYENDSVYNRFSTLQNNSKFNFLASLDFSILIMNQLQTNGLMVKASIYSDGHFGLSLGWAMGTIRKREYRHFLYRS